VTDRTTTSTEVATLFQQAQAGDALSLAQLMHQHDGLVHHMVHRQWHGPLSYAQLLHEGRIGLWRAILGFDPQRGFAFSTYASIAIARHIWRAVERATEQQQEDPGPGEDTLAQDPLNSLLEQEVQQVLHAMVEHLSPRQRWVVRAYYGLDGQGAHTLAHLGSQLGCTRQAVYYHLRKALLHLRHPAFSATLRALLGRNRRRDYLQALRPIRRRS